MIVDSDLSSCPEIVARYLRKVGVVGSKRKTFANILHGGEFRLKPEQKKWFTIKGEYIFNPEVPSFTWKASIKIFPLIFISVLDEYMNGVGRSLVKLESIITISNQTGSEISESSLGRLLVEFVMMPTAFVPSERLHWEYVDLNHARVVFSDNNFKVEAVFKFDENDLPVKTTINRFGTFEGKMAKNSFVCDLSDYKLLGGLLVPTDIRGGWDLSTGPFYWFHFKINNVHFRS